MKMLADLLVRYGALSLLALVTAIMVLAGLSGAGWSGWLLLLLPLTGLGLWDLLQRSHTLLRNYPLAGHLRWLFELTRPYLRQYIVESDLSGRPYNRAQRSLVYERAKNTVDSQPFGTDFNVYDNQYELMTHSIIDRRIGDTDFRVRVGGPQCSRAICVHTTCTIAPVPTRWRRWTGSRTSSPPAFCWRTRIRRPMPSGGLQPPPTVSSRCRPPDRGSIKGRKTEP